VGDVVEGLHLILGEGDDLVEVVEIGGPSSELVQERHRLRVVLAKSTVLMHAGVQRAVGEVDLDAMKIGEVLDTLESGTVGVREPEPRSGHGAQSVARGAPHPLAVGRFHAHVAVWACPEPTAEEV